MGRKLLDGIADVRRGRPATSKDGKTFVRMSIAVPEKVRDAAMKLETIACSSGTPQNISY